ncbi:cytochrome [Sesamum alatum]|uniref:Cytochrome n=1 Tax=Sesamum alatum TaxID=300844 RepID=A0AAE1YC53_9LAMI|nr:cytochrome [Sesamum alatum]
MEFVHNLTGHKSRLVRAFKRFDKFFTDVIEERLNSHGRKEQKDFVDILLEVQQDEHAEMPLTMDNVKAILLVSDHGDRRTTSFFWPSGSGSKVFSASLGIIPMEAAAERLGKSLALMEEEVDKLIIPQAVWSGDN